jgi:hydroxymethylglutaryl-CoA reductase
VEPINGFSKLSKIEKLNVLVDRYLAGNQGAKNRMLGFWHADEKEQKVFDEFSENTLTNFYFPYGVAPNVLINNELYCVPMVIEESSVVAAASKAAKYWYERGGFKTTVLGTEKLGQVHMIWKGSAGDIQNLFEQVKPALIEAVGPLMTNMQSRGGGLTDLKLVDRSSDEEGLWQIWASFETCDAMGANFINSVLEAIGREFEQHAHNVYGADSLFVVMAILSNYTPNCLVRAEVSCAISELAEHDLGMSAERFAEKFSRAVRIAKIDVQRATTHNKGIMNGVDAVVLATGNDFRAVEACAHTYASRNGRYESLSNCEIANGQFRFWLDIPMALGTVGGLTALHPMAKTSLDLLGRPSASRLMEISAAIGLAQNFGALRSLVTSGIQRGHMKMHLMNILNHLEATEEERNLARDHFTSEAISFKAVRDFVATLRNYQ